MRWPEVNLLHFTQNWFSKNNDTSFQNYKSIRLAYVTIHIMGAIVHPKIHIFIFFLFSSRPFKMHITDFLQLK